MLRHPAEIIASAKKSYGDWQTDASRARAWLNVILETERVTRGGPARVRRLRGPADRLARRGRSDRRDARTCRSWPRRRPRALPGGRRVRRPVAAPQPRRLGSARRAGSRAGHRRRRLGPHATARGAEAASPAAVHAALDGARGPRTYPCTATPRRSRSRRYAVSRQAARNRRRRPATLRVRSAPLAGGTGSGRRIAAAALRRRLRGLATSLRGKIASLTPCR